MILNCIQIPCQTAIIFDLFSKAYAKLKKNRPVLDFCF